MESVKLVFLQNHSTLMVSSLQGPYNGPAGHEMTDDARPCLHVQVAKNTIFFVGVPKKGLFDILGEPKNGFRR